MLKRKENKKEYVVDFLELFVDNILTMNLKQGSIIMSKPTTTFQLTTQKGNTYTFPIKYQGQTNVSQIIRSMIKDGYTKWEVHKVTNIRYQMIRNILIQPTKK